MFVLAMFPHVWFSIMNPKVAEWAQGDMSKVNVDPEAKDEMFTRYHSADKKKAA